MNDFLFERIYGHLGLTSEKPAGGDPDLLLARIQDTESVKL